MAVPCAGQEARALETSPSADLAPRDTDAGHGPVAESLPLPEGTLFPQLIADPKQPHFFGTLEHLRPRGSDHGMRVAAIGFGEDFGLWRTSHGSSDWQVSVLAGVFAQFNLDATTSYAMINSDYQVGVPITWRRLRWSTRLRVFHESSHLGDEYMAGNPEVEPRNISHEELELSLAREGVASGWRLYAGSGYRLHSRPSTFKRWRAQVGAEYNPRPGGRSNRLRTDSRRLTPVAGADVQFVEEQGWKANTSLVVGIQFQRSQATRQARLLVHFYRGFNTYGQFYDEQIWRLGLGLHLVF